MNADHTLDVSAIREAEKAERERTAAPTPEEDE